MHTYTVSLRIEAQALDATQVTRELGLNPTQTRTVGERRSATTTWDKALLELEVFPDGRSDWDSLEKRLEALLGMLATQTGLLHGYAIDGGPRLSAEILKRLGNFGAPLQLETHFAQT